MKDGLKEKIEELIKGLMVSHDETDEENEITETPEEYMLYIDSIRFIELITAIESEFQIELCSDDLAQEGIKELDNLVSIVRKYME